MLAGKAACDGALVQSVPNADALELGQSADAGIVVQFVDHGGVGDETAATRYGGGNLAGDDAAQVGSMVVQRLADVVLHHVVDFIHATLHGLGERAAGNDGIKLDGDVHCLEFFEDVLLAEVKLVGNVGELLEFLGRVVDVFYHHSLLVVEDGGLGAGRSWIDN